MTRHAYGAFTLRNVHAGDLVLPICRVSCMYKLGEKVFSSPDNQGNLYPGNPCSRIFFADRAYSLRLFPLFDQIRSSRRSGTADKFSPWSQRPRYVRWTTMVSVVL